MRDLRSRVLSCAEHERLEFELLDVRSRGQYLTRLRGVSREERTALSRLADHDLEHGCSR
jgi:hypothetical protein